MKKRDCTNCHYAKWKRYKSGRRMFDHSAVCEYPEIDLPFCYFDKYQQLPRRNTVTKYTKPGCPMWKKIGKQDSVIKNLNKQFEGMNYVRKKLHEL